MWINQAAVDILMDEFVNPSTGKSARLLDRQNRMIIASFASKVFRDFSPF